MIIPIATGLLIALLALMAAIYMALYRRMRHLRREEQLVMSRARQKAVRLIQHARDQALNIIAHAKISANKHKLKLEENLDKISADQLREFQKLISNISKDIEKDAVKEIGEFKQAMEMETIQSQRVVAQKIEQQYNQVQQEVAAYEQDRLAFVDKHVYEIIKEVARKVTGKVIPVEEHHELIMSALEEAKKKNVI